MYEPGSLYFFKPFHFTDGTSKPKYFLTLYADSDAVIVASLPSSVDYIPAHVQKKHGCLNDLPSDFNAYCFFAGVPVTDTGWGFEKHTYLYGLWVNCFSLKELQANYQVEGVDYEFKGRISNDEYLAIIKCFLSARTLKNKLKNFLKEARY